MFSRAETGPRLGEEGRRVKKLSKIGRADGAHWVGDGFPVRTMFSYNTHGADISPFLLLDYAGPAEFPPSSKPRGVAQHPHRGFETVTVVYQGEVEHRDTAGNEGRIGPGDVQWMTAARGILHEEMHGRAFAEAGGTLEMLQLWVNLPAKDKMSAPRYQAITDRMIPAVPLAGDGGDGGFVRVIAGDYGGVKGPARTFTPVNLWDLRLEAGHETELNLPDGFTTLLLVLRGRVRVNHGEAVAAAELAIFERQGRRIALAAQEDATIAVMNGQPIDEPVVGYGPFVMNTREEIAQAMADFRADRF